jgi:hypothetical protein
MTEFVNMSQTTLRKRGFAVGVQPAHCDPEKSAGPGQA